jgi:hypothetical protein
MANSVSVAIWLEKIGLQSRSPIFEIVKCKREAHLYAKLKGEIYTPYIGISLV